MTHIPRIPVVLDLSHARKFALLIWCPVSQFAVEHIDDLSGRGGVVIEETGFYAFHVPIYIVSRGEGLHAPVAPMSVPHDSVQARSFVYTPCSTAHGLVY